MIDDALLERARQCKYCRAALRELAAHLPAGDEALDRTIAHTVATRDAPVFCCLLLAALGAGRRVEARHLAEGAALLSDPAQLAAAALHAQGDAAQALLQAVQRGNMGAEMEASALLLAGVWCDKRNHGVFPAGLAASARSLARWHFDSDVVQVQLLLLADLMKDESLKSSAKTSEDAPDVPAAQDLMNRVIDGCLADPLAAAPEQAPAGIISGHTVRRAVPRIGRNDPCPCGSGKKYKKCCWEKDQERLRHSSEVAGLTVEELQAEIEAHLTVDRLYAMRAHELVKLDPAKLAPALHGALLDQLTRFHEFEALLRGFDQAGYRNEFLHAWIFALHEATSAGRKDVVERLLQVRANDPPSLEEIDTGARLLLAEDNPRQVLDMIESSARAGLESEDQDVNPLLDLTFALLDSRYPALGILVARGALATCCGADGVVLLDALSDARAKLNLAGDEPLGELLDAIFAQRASRAETSLRADELDEARRNLEAKSQEVRHLRDSLAKVQRELEQRQRAAPPPMAGASATVGVREKGREGVSEQGGEGGVRLPPLEFAPTPPPSAPAAPALDERALGELRQRVAHLKSELKERHSERNQLRRELLQTRQDLEALRKKTTAQPAAPAEAPRDDETQHLLPEEPLTVQPVRLLEFPKDFQQTLGPLPKPVARAAVITAGRLAAGEPAAFVGATRLQRNHAVWRQRVGGDYRLLFRLEPQTLRVLALVNRKDFEKKIKTLV